MDHKFFAACFFFAVLSCNALKCHEDSLEPNDNSYHLNDCSAATKFCAVLSNSKTSETFHACATEKMCTKVGSFDYVQHEELHIRCCNKDACNSVTTVTISLGTLVLTIFVSFMRL